MRESLEIVTCHFNPMRYEVTTENYKAFADHMKQSGVRLITVECALGERPFVVTQADNPDHLQVRSSTVLWLKENLLNLGFQKLSPSCGYVGWFDSDITFRQEDWAEKAVHALQRFKIIQPWSDVYDLGPQDQHCSHFKGFCRQHYHREPYCATQAGKYPYWHPGFAWCIRREILERLGGLLELAILGAGDHHMALSMIGKGRESVHGEMTKAYFDYVQQWQDRATFHVGGNIGYLPGTIEHTFHGKKVNRKYWSRWDILTRNQYDPFKDIKKNLYGVIELDTHKPDLRHGIDMYFSQRDEDINSLG